MAVVAGDSCVLSGGVPLHGRVKPPGDKSISHRALLLAALAPGESKLVGLSNGEDVAHMAKALQQLGAQIDWQGRGDSAGQQGAGAGGVVSEAGAGEAGTPGLASEVIVKGGDWHQPEDVIYAGNSGTCLRLLAGVCASWPITATLDGDASLRSRPMNRIAEPLTQMGATITPAADEFSRTDELKAPLTITGSQLTGIDYTLPVASAQVKGAILLAGLRASSQTIVRERHPTRIHTEEMLQDWGADVTVGTSEDGLRFASIIPSQITPRTCRIPSDPSQGAFWAVAALCIPQSDIAIENIYLGAGRDGFIKVLERMGARMVARPATRMLHVRTSDLSGTEVLPAEVPGLIDEIPVLAVAAAHAHGTTRFLGVGELRAKESDRIATTAALIRALGGSAEDEEGEDSLVIHGSGGLTAGEVNSGGDHRIAMAAAVAALTDAEETAIDGWSCVATSYPNFLQDLAKLQKTHDPKH